MSPIVSAAMAPAEWDAYVRQSAAATGYHRWCWREVFERAFGHQTHYLVARRGHTVAGILPLVEFRSVLWGRFAVSLPFVNYGGVVADDAAAARALVEAALDLARRRTLAHIELRHTERQLDEMPARQHKVAMRLPLAASGEEMWSALDRKARNQVRKAQKSGLAVATGGRELLPHFYDVFAENMRDLGTPVYHRGFFGEVVARLGDDARVVIVWKGTTAAAAALTCRYRGTVEVPWASSRREFLPLCPNTLLYWTIIEQAVSEGASVLDFGRSTPDEGTYRFKLQWGARPHPLWWEYVMVNRGAVPDRSPGNPKFRLAIAAWKRLPLSAATMLGPHIVRSIP